MGNIRDELGGPDPGTEDELGGPDPGSNEDVLLPGADAQVSTGQAPRVIQPKPRLAGKEVNVSPEAARALRQSAAEAVASAKPEWRTGGPGSPGEPGSGDGKPPGGLAPDAPVPPQPWYKRAWTWIKGQQGPST